MPRYFIEISYKGTDYAGFQIQQNANTIQAEVEKALHLLLYKANLTGSSRTDAGVHAVRNFFHFDIENSISNEKLHTDIYKLNAILPNDIVVKSMFKVDDNAHCRFNAKSRSYKYYIHQQKDPFLQHTSFYYPYTLNVELMQEAAAEILKHYDFTSFSKKHTQVKTFNCTVNESKWEKNAHQLIYHVTANRFLRGMVKGLVGTMLQVGRKNFTFDQFINIFLSQNNSQADFSVPSHGLFLTNVQF